MAGRQRPGRDDVRRIGFDLPLETNRDVANDETERKDIKRALIFGVVMATIELGIVLWLAYC